MTAERHVPQEGDYLEQDGCGWGECIIRDTETYTDSGWPGCDWRIKRFPALSIGINIVVTGGRHYVRPSGNWRSRCKIEFVGDCEPSTFSGGWIYHKG